MSRSKIKLLANMACEYGSGQAGDEVVLPSEVAQSIVDGGFAEMLEDGFSELFEDPNKGLKSDDPERDAYRAAQAAQVDKLDDEPPPTPPTEDRKTGKKK